MKNFKELKGMETKEMMKCDGCGGYHPLEDCEIVIIRMVKGKNCEMPSPNVKELPQVIAPSFRSDVIVRDAPAEPATVAVAPGPIKKKIIPPGIASMMIPPTSPHFESHGAKEFRTA